MKKIIFGIFAHPDDEAFGPSATLLKERSDGAEIHLICATAGEAGSNPDNHDDLANVRLTEWREAGALLGASTMNYLEFNDGQLCNNDFFTIENKCEVIIRAIADKQDQPYEIELMTFDLNGLTGHLDHILISRVTCHLHQKLKEQMAEMSRLRLFCLPREDQPDVNYDWIYMEAGRGAEQIDEIVDARDHFKAVDEIMRTHKSQVADYEAHIKNGERVAINHFIVIE